MHDFEFFDEEEFFEYDDYEPAWFEAYGGIIFTVLAILTFCFFRLYLPYQETQPVSLTKLISLHENEKVTKDILAKHMYAKPKGVAVKPIRSLADAGNMHAQNITCWVYSDGFNVTVNHELAAQYCHKAAAQGHPGAQMNLAIHYAEHAAVRNIDKAIHYYTLAAEKRPDAAWYLSKIYGTYPEPYRSLQKANHYKIKAANGGNNRAMMSLAEDYEDGRSGLEIDNALAEKYYKMAIEAGHVDANAWISVFYREAEPPFSSDEKMVFHAKKGILLNRHPIAYGVLADAYMNGRGVEKNEMMAAHYYRGAAERGSDYAIAKLASIDTKKMRPKDAGFLYDGVLLPYAVKNVIIHPSNFHQLYDSIHNKTLNPLEISKVFEYYADGILGEHEDGEMPLGLLSSIYSGQGYSSYLEPVVEAYETRYSYGSGKHAYELGLIYMSGSGVKRNAETSMLWISKAMDLGYPDRSDYVGMYFTRPDNPVEKETQFARNALQKAAILGSERAAETLAEIYQDGLGVPANQVAALYWFDQADRGRINKEKEIHAIRESMSPDDIKRAEYLMNNCEKSDFEQCIQRL